MSGDGVDAGFRSILVEDDGYLRVALRYNHLNPVRGKLVPSLDALARHPWTRHSRLMGLQGAGGAEADGDSRVEPAL